MVAFIGVGMIAPWLAFPEQTQSMLTFKCEQPLGPFTLGPDSNPSDAQIATLCSCIWDSLDPATRKLNEALNAGKQASEDEKKAYSEALGSAFQKCGALEL